MSELKLSEEVKSQDKAVFSAMMHPRWDEVKQYKVSKRNGSSVIFAFEKMFDSLRRACDGYEAFVSPELILQEAIKDIFNGIDTKDISEVLILGATAQIEKDPAYSKVSARLLLQKLYKEVIKKSINNENLKDTYGKSFIKGIKLGVENKIFDEKLLDFNLELLANSLDINKDDDFEYIGLHVLYDRYLMKKDKDRFELPQTFFMRVAMGLALNEKDKNTKAIEFYELLSSLRFVSSTPTLLHSGLTRAQLSSCYLATVNDDLIHIFKSYGDIAQLSKWSGGVAADWTNIRSTGALIETIKVDSQGLIPFLKIANDVTAAINRSGKRRSATVAYLETWHLDLEDFLDLRRNTGDERRRAHDMNFANWIPDLFIKRVMSGGEWTLFSPNEVPDLHSSYGKIFEEKYEAYELKAKMGGIEKFKVMPAKELWRKMITRLFETGYAWMTFKDPSNIRSPQDHAGVVNCSNLCTEITLNTSKEETAVCNLGSVNLGKHIVNGELDEELFKDTVTKAIRMLDNVIDINYYPTKEAEYSNLKHRPIGLGMMGYQDALFNLNLAMDDKSVLEWTDQVTEKFSYYAILESSKLAKELGKYSSYEGSKWSRNLLPLDTVDLLEKERGIKVEVSRDSHMNWDIVRDHIKKYGMRNSNTMAIAPTATISNIAGCYPCIEPLYSNLYVKSNMAGEFTVINNYLVKDLKDLNLWSQDMLDQIKYYDGSIQEIANIPDSIKQKYKTAFELDPMWLIKLTAARSKWIDQSISHNIFMKGASGSKLNDVYLAAWKSGMKTTYYLRSLSISQIEKSTLDAKKFGYTQKRDYDAKSSVDKDNINEK